MKTMPMLLAGALALTSPLLSEENTCDCPCHQEECSQAAENQYNPNYRYYRYCSIYHDSVIKEDVNNGPSWASRRDDTFMDEFMR